MGAIRHFLQARGHAVAEEDDGGPHQRDLLEEPLPALGRRVKGGAAEAERGVAGEAEVTDGEGAVGELLAHPRFQIAVGALALQQRVAEEEDAVAGEDFKRRRGGAGDGEGEEEDEEGAHGGLAFVDVVGADGEGNHGVAFNEKSGAQIALDDHGMDGAL